MIESLPPIIGAEPVALILGSMPGPESLRVQQYYAHPQNAFWPILFALFKQGYSIEYDVRRKLIEENALILWDVLGSCEREGALDADIRHPVPNDIAGLIGQYPTLRMVALNGGRAAAEYKRLGIDVPAVRLPSTSPAYAAMSRARKTAAWHEALGPYLK